MVTWPQISIDTDRGHSMCFGCGQDNPIGLKLSFQWDGTPIAEGTSTQFVISPREDKPKNNDQK